MERSMIWSLAKVAGEANRFAESAELMKRIAELNLQLTMEEGELLSLSYEKVMAAHVESWKSISEFMKEVEDKPNSLSELRSMRFKAEERAYTTCNEVLLIVDKLVPSSSAEAMRFYLKMKEKFYGHLARFYEDLREAADFSRQSCVKLLAGDENKPPVGFTQGRTRSVEVKRKADMQSAKLIPEDKLWMPKRKVNSLKRLEFPEWLLWELLPHLELRTILRCRLLSKSWNAIISSNFNRLYKDQLLVLMMFKTRSEIWFPFSKFQPHFKTKVRYPEFQMRESAHGVSNGMIFGWPSQKDELVVGNVITNQWRKWYEEPYNWPPHIDGPSDWGFDVDPATGNYRIYFVPGDVDDRKHAVEYRSASGEWSEVEKTPLLADGSEDEPKAKCIAANEVVVLVKQKIVSRFIIPEEIMNRMATHAVVMGMIDQQLIGNVITCHVYGTGFEYFMAYDMVHCVWDSFKTRHGPEDFMTSWEALVPTLDKP